MILKSTVLLFFFISFSLLVRGSMGTCHSKSDKIKRDKNHNRQKFGIRFGRNDLNLEGHLQMGYNSKTIKNYGPIDKQLNPQETTTSAVTEPDEQLTEASEN